MSNQVKTPEKIEYIESTITCSCGVVYNVGSTVKQMNVEVCAACHPFYTGTQKFVDTGRLEKFQAKIAAGEAHKKVQATRDAKKAAQAKELADIEKEKSAKKEDK